ncbi:MAG TPA: DUF935 family protein, partial [Vicinamibacterales bacterium]|nr:DUF935 family protein [Vicinamibacterales bacterium]
AALEKHWERRPGERVPYHVAELGWVHPRRLSFGPERELRLIDGNIYPYDFQPIGFDLRQAPHKFITFQPQLFNEYAEREGLAPPSLYWSFFKRFSARERMVLLDLFGKPWRIVFVDDDSNAGDAALEEAYKMADALGDSVTAQFPKGVKLQTVWPDPKSGELHNLTIKDCDRQISKLWLGGTGTTEGESRGLNDNTADVHADEEQDIFESDGILISDRFQCDLVESIVLVNAPWFGFRSAAEALRYVPSFKLKTEKPEDREKALQALKLIIDMGVAVPVDQVRSVGGVRKPKPDEAVVQMVESPQDDMSSRYIEPRPRVIDPSHSEPGQTLEEPPDAEEVYQTPTAAQQSPEQSPEPQAEAAPPRKPNPQDDDEWDLFYGPILSIQGELAGLEITAPSDGVTNFPVLGSNLRVSLRNSRFKVAHPSIAAELKAKWPQIWKLGGGKLGSHIYGRLAPIAQSSGVVQTDVDEEAVRLREAWAAQHVDDTDLAGVVAQLKWLVVGSQGLDRMMRTIAAEQARQKAKDVAVAPMLAGDEAIATEGHIHLAKQPSTVHGSPETIIEKGLASGLPILTAWAREVARATEGYTRASEIRASIRKAISALDTRRLSAVVEQRMIHSAMLGALDAEWEAEHDDVIQPVTFAGQKNFTRRPFAEAIAFFTSKNVVTKSVFERLLGSAKRAAFTIAGLAKKEMLQVGFEEVARIIEAGGDLRSFKRSLNARFDSAGWTRINDSHAETIMRNAVMGAYSSGRKAQMTQPHVLKARPYWQIKGVNDSRTRKAHGAAHGKVLRASDPFWKRAPTPWG